MANVLLVPPLWGTIPPTILSGYPQTGGRTPVPVSYSNWFPSEANAADGVDKLDAAMRAQTGPFEVLSHSMGSQVVYKWIREKGPTASWLDPGDVRFIVTGCPERRYNGNPPNGGNYPGGVVGVGTGIPLGIPWTLIDFAAQYDGWADFPNVTTNSNANINAFLGTMTFGPHGNYTQYDLDNPDNLSFTPGDNPNVTYMLSPTPLMPLANMFWYTPSSQQSQDGTLRPQVEAAYTRPMGEPAAPTFEAPPITYIPPQIPVSDDAVDRRIFQEAP